MIEKKTYIILADDDLDDCLFFSEALEALPLSTFLTVVNDGEELIQLLTKEGINLPSALFLDLNMPRKDGFKCLLEIKGNNRLDKIPVVIISTSYDRSIAERLYQNGASYYIRKPIEFSKLRDLVSLAIERITIETLIQPGMENFLLRV